MEDEAEVTVTFLHRRVSGTDRPGGLGLNMVPVVYLGRGREVPQDEVIADARRVLEGDWDHTQGPPSDWHLIGTGVVRVCREWVVGSGPANVTTLHPRPTLAIDPSHN